MKPKRISGYHLMGLMTNAKRIGLIMCITHGVSRKYCVICVQIAGVSKHNNNYYYSAHSKRPRMSRLKLYICISYVQIEMRHGLIARNGCFFSKTLNYVVMSIATEIFSLDLLATINAGRTKLSGHEERS